MVNKVILVGNSGADAEVHVFENGNKIARIRIATTERIYNPTTQQWTDHIEWHQVIIPHRQAHFAESYIKKGSQVYVEGRIRRREWGEEGAKHYSFEIRADEVRLLGRRPDSYDHSNHTNSHTSTQQQHAQPQTEQNSTTSYQQPLENSSQTHFQEPVAESKPSYTATPPSNPYNPEPSETPQAQTASTNNPTDDLPF